MELRNLVAPVLVFPTALRQRVFGEQWQKGKIDVDLRNVEETLTVKTRPLPYLELLFKVTNRLPATLQVFSANVEVWLGKPIVQFQTFVSEQLQPGETRETFRAYTFLNPYQVELLNPPKKDSLPPNCNIILTISCRSSLGVVEKTVKSPAIPPKVI